MSHVSCQNLVLTTRMRGSLWLKIIAQDLRHENVWALTAFPHHTLFVSIFARKSSKGVKTSLQDVKWCHDVILWHHINDNMDLCSLHRPSIIPKFMFFKMATLTFDSYEILSKAMPTPSWRFGYQTVCGRKIDGTKMVPLWDSLMVRKTELFVALFWCPFEKGNRFWLSFLYGEILRGALCHKGTVLVPFSLKLAAQEW